MKATKIALISMIAAILPSTVNASIFVISNDTQARAFDNIGGGVLSSFTGTGMPTSTVLNAIGNSYSKNFIDWSQIGAQTTFSFSMKHSRLGTNSYSFTSDNALYLYTDSDTNYHLSGEYQVTDSEANSSGEVYQFVRFFDSGTNTTLFENTQVSRNTSNEHFTLGATEGDYLNSMAGSLTGTLLAGHAYRLAFTYTTYSFPDADSGASALGNITLKIGEAPAAVPEPLSVIVWGCLIAGTCVAQCSRDLLQRSAT